MSVRRFNPRRPAVDESHRFLSSKHPNPMAVGFGTLLREVLDDEILPKSGEFEPTEPLLYTASRQWVDPLPPPLPVNEYSEYLYEQCLFLQFWDPGEPQLVLIESYPGSGKSTLLKYFFRSWCPRHPDPSTSVHHADDYKLFVHVDVSTADTTEDFDRIFFSGVRERIERACDSCGFSIEEDAHYAMWGHVHHWDRPVHLNAEKSYESRTHYRSQLVTQAKEFRDPRAWSESALTHLTRAISGTLSGSKSPFDRLVLCIDNIDQCSPEVQLHAMLLVKSWMSASSSIKFWRIFVPLWPVTLEDLMARLDPIGPLRKIFLGPLSPRFIEKRATRLVEEFNSVIDGANIEEVPTDKEQRVSISECDDVVSEAMLRAKPPFDRIIMSLAGGSTRKQLAMWKSTLSSFTVLDSARKDHDGMSLPDRVAESLESGGRETLKINPSPLIDGLMTGEYLAHNRGDCPVANLFYLGPKLRNAHDLLIGVHLVHLVRAWGHSSRRAVWEALEPLAYERSTVEHALELLAKYQLISWRLDSEGGDGPFKPSDLVISGYESLLSQKIYIDNVAQTTPVSMDTLKSILPTQHSVAEDFLPRVRGSLAFLRELARAERDFCEPELAGVDHEELNERLDAVRLPCYSRKVSRSYLKHFEDIARGVRGRVGEEARAHIEEVQSDELFRMTDNYPPLLTSRLG